VALIRDSRVVLSAGPNLGPPPPNFGSPGRAHDLSRKQQGKKTIILTLANVSQRESHPSRSIIVAKS